MIESTLAAHARFWRGNEARARRALLARACVLSNRGYSREAIAADREHIECGLDIEFARLKACEVDQMLIDVRTMRDSLRASATGVPPLPPLQGPRALLKGES